MKDTKSSIVTVDPFDALKIISLGITKMVSLLAKSMTADHEDLLKYILLLHSEPENIVQRISNTCLIKAPVLSKPLKEFSDQNNKALL